MKSGIVIKAANITFNCFTSCNSFINKSQTTFSSLFTSPDDAL